MRDQLIALIIRDRTRLLSLGTSLVLATIGALLTRAVGIEIDKETEIVITGAVTLILGWMFDAWALDQTVKGVKAMQRTMAQVDPAVEEDGVVGPVTIGATEDLVIAKAKSRQG